jgi:hypothetical protein
LYQPDLHPVALAIVTEEPLRKVYALLDRLAAERAANINQEEQT